jgi:16S rRNA (uracil1498-N3)-methyltransferase
MSERFFTATSIAGTRAELTGDEARHLAAVMRAAVGDEVVLFDGSGAEFVARVLSVRKQNVELEVIERREVTRELPQSLTLAVALPKGERQKWLIEKATELGVQAIIPLITERGVAQPVEAALDRLRRSVIEACKQCGRNRLLEICPPQTATDLFQAMDQSALRLIAESAGLALAVAFGSGLNERAIIAAIGPEGGFTPAELAAAKAAGWQAVSLGPAILRVETAAIAVAAWAATRGI